MILIALEAMAHGIRSFFILKLCFFSPKNNHLIGPWLWLLVRKRLNFSLFAKDLVAAKA
jgi:hypothetical protein